MLSPKLRLCLCINLVQPRLTAAGSTFWLLLSLAMGAFPAWAQTGASLSGVVTDRTGAPLAGVAVTIRNAGSGAAITIATDGGGHYHAAGLLPGTFEIRAAKQGFAEETHAGIILAAGQDST